MPKERACPECGRPLPVGALAGVCPFCSLATALKDIPASLFEAQALRDGSHSSTLASRTVARFGDYELLELLARGGMGVVYKARQISLSRTVALKMIQTGELASAAEVKRFHAEAEAIGRLHHPNIVAIHEFGEHDGQHYFSMDYVSGRTLAEVVREGPLPIIRAVTYVRTVAAAVQYAHEHGIIHRDLKPANVIIDEHDQPRITDFGLAKRLTDFQLSTLNPQLTLSGQVLGSPNYLPPEQAEPTRGPPSPSSDVYALGAILYHLITGRPPFQAESLTTLLRQVIESEPVSPRMLNPSIPKDIEIICLKCLEKEPHRRYATAQALSADLQRFLNHEPISARPVGVAGRTLRWCGRRPVRASLAAGLVLVLVLGMSGILWQWRRAERARLTALRQAYAGDMNQVQRSLERRNDVALGRARELLARYRPKAKGEADLRGWEWRYLWGLCQSDEHLILTQSSDTPSSLLFASDGKLLVTYEYPVRHQFWDLTVRRQIGTLTNAATRRVVGFSGDGQIIISDDGDAQGNPLLSFWNVMTGQLVRKLPQPARVTSLALSPDAKRLVTCHVEPDSRFRLWEIASGKLLMERPSAASYTGTKPRARFSPDGTILAFGEPRGQIALLNLLTGVSNLIPCALEGVGVLGMAFSPDSRLLASSYGWTDTTIRLWDVATGQPVGTLNGHQRSVDRLVFAPDGKTLFSASRDQSIGIWDVRQRRQIRQLRGHEGAVTDLALSPDGRTLVSSSDEDGTVRIWDLQAKARAPAEHTLPLSVGRFGVVFTRDNHLITVSPANPVMVWETSTATERAQIPALGTNNQSAALSPDERFLAVGGQDGTLKLWDLQRQSLVKQWPAHRLPIFRLCFLDRGRSLLSAATPPNLKNELKRWQVGSWREIPVAPTNVVGCWGVAQSPNERFLALSYGPSKPLEVWDTASGRLEATLGARRGFCPAFSGDGRLMAAAFRVYAGVWEVGSWRQVAHLAINAYSVAFSPEGDRLVTGTLVPGNIRSAVTVWDYRVERELLSLNAEESWAPWTGWTEFSADGNTLLAVSWTGAVKLWHAPSWVEIEAAERERKPNELSRN